MSALATVQRPAGLPAVFQNTPNLPDMNAAGQAGLSAGFAVIGYKGSKWHLKHRGETEMLMDGGAPKPFLSVVIVGVAPQISKQWYEKKFTEGDDASPDCFSLDGVAPDDASPKKQATACQACPRNVWGSRITENGKKAKECQDSRRIAVVPSGDILNESYGGPMLLRIPPTSLANYATFARECSRFGVQPYQVETKLSFDYTVAYPLLTFTPTGYVTNDATALQILEVMKDDIIPRMLNEETTETTHAQPVASALAVGAPSAVLAISQPATPVSTGTTVDNVVPLNAPVAGASSPPAVVATPEPVIRVEETLKVQTAPSDLGSAIDALLNL